MAGIKSAVRVSWTDKSNQKALAARIDSIMGDGFTQQLLDIKSHVEKPLTRAQNEIINDVLERAVLSEYRAFQQFYLREIF